MTFAVRCQTQTSSADETLVSKYGELCRPPCDRELDQVIERWRVMLGPCDRVLDQINCIELLYVTAVQQRGFGSMPALAQECTARNEETPASFPPGALYLPVDV